jgi:acyl-CoA synthetase (AMP-forming)/AMP-acid ligase II
VTPDPRQLLTYDALLREHARSRPQHVAVVDGEVSLRYPELDARVDRLAGVLAAEGAVDGERVLWLGQNSFRVLELVLACARVGAVFCPANWRQSPAELRFVIDDFTPRVVVWQEAEVGEATMAAKAATEHLARWIRHDTDAADGYEAAVAAGEPVGERDVDPAQGLLALYTAAFGGTPQAAVLSHTALLFQDLVIGRMQDVTDASVFLNSGPLFHIATFATTSATFHHGGTNVFVRRTDAEEICRLVEAHRCTHAFLMPPTIEQIRDVNADGRYDLSSLWDAPDPVRYRSGMISPVGSPWFARPGGYGQTEVVGLTTLRGLGGEAIGSAGRPTPASTVRIVDPDGRDVAPGEVGEIVVRGPTVMVGYHDRPELDAQRGRDGWHHTNDLGRREADGSVSFVGPMARLIKSAAENIYPAEVEACLRQHPAVRDVCVIGVPDPRWVQSVRAVVVLHEGADTAEDELIEHCRSRIASYKKPRSVLFTDELPRTAQGTVDRDAVDQRFGGGGYPGVG